MYELFQVKNRIVLITGSSRGLGKTYAEAFAAAGATVIVNGRSQPTARQTAEEIISLGGRAHFRVCDVADSQAVSAMVESIEREIGEIDVLVNNAGIQKRAPLTEMSDAQWLEVIDINLNAAFYTARAVAKGMMERKRGKIINISSLISLRARPTIANYSASKSGLNGLTRSMAVEWGTYNIQTNGIVPGYFLTELTQVLKDDPEFDAFVCGNVPLARWGEPQELTGALIFLASDASNYINGQLIVVDGGWSINL